MRELSSSRLNADSPINKYDFYKLAQERSDLAIKVLNKDQIQYRN